MKETNLKKYPSDYLLILDNTKGLYKYSFSTEAKMK